MRRRKTWILLIIVIVAAVSFREPAEKYFDIAKSLDIFATLFKEVNTYYVEDVDPQKLIRRGIDGMLESLDPYTDYIPEDEIENFRITTTGQYGGIGALIGIVNNRTVITHPYQGFPAFKAGLRVGDEIVSVNGKNIKDQSTFDVSTLLKGQPKTDVEIKVRRYGEKSDLTFKIRREKISISNLAYYGMFDSEIGYIKLDDFTPGATREVTQALEELKSKGAKKLILDLRENPGGLLHEAVNIVNIFISKGKDVVSTKGKVPEWNKTYTTLNTPVDITIPMVILTSEGSASASEIVAGSLQDYDRAVLIGRKTFGKGLVQTTRPLAYHAQLKVTTAKYYIPSGRCIQELDYAHRKDDGTVSKIADSLRSEFKTKNGRKVYDGGGLDPDIPVEENYLGAITQTLISEGLLFEYSIKYCAEHSVIHDLKSFRISDKEYEQFASWVKTQKFSYATSLEQKMNDLIASAKKERYYAELQDYLDGLKSKVEADKTSDLIRFKKEIVLLLEQQIAFNYALNKGQIEVSFNRDMDVNEAIAILNDSQRYNDILSGN